MSLDNDADWDRAFFAWLIGGMGIGPFLFGWWGMLWVPQDSEGGAIVRIFTQLAGFMFLIALLLGHWPRLRPTEGEDRWRISRGGTWIFSVLLGLAVWPTIVYVGIALQNRF